METLRKPFIGVLNIILFNWPMYVSATTVLLVLMAITIIVANLYIFLLTLLLALSVLLSIFVSYYVYDHSSLYQLDWLDQHIHSFGHAANIHAGFDETSELLIDKYRGLLLNVFDFYDPAKHTESSIKRARKIYPGFPGTIKVETNHIPMPDGSMDNLILIFAAHEIREGKERKVFFEELYRIIKPGANIIVTEHLRDWKNFIAFNIGFFHFYSRSCWLSIFKNANLNIVEEIHITPFVTTFILQRK